MLVSVPILLAQRQTINPLREHLQNRMLHLLLIPPVQKTICQSRQQIHPPVNLAQEESAAVGADRAAVKTGHDLARTAGFKPKTELVTLCRSKAVSSLAQTCCGKYVYARIGGLLLHLCEISGLTNRWDWTGSQIRVHAFYGLLGISLLEYLHQKAQAAWAGLSLEQFLEELRPMQQFALLYPPLGEKGPNRIATISSKQTDELGLRSTLWSP